MQHLATSSSLLVRLFNQIADAEPDSYFDSDEANTYSIQNVFFITGPNMNVMTIGEVAVYIQPRARDAIS